MGKSIQIKLTLEYGDTYLEIEAPDHPELNLSQWAAGNAKQLADRARMMYRVSHKEKNT